MLVFTIAFLAIGTVACATHIVGGEIYYTHLGSDEYELTLKVYRDCGPANSNQTGFDQFAMVGIFVSGNMYTQLDLPLTSAEVNFVPVQLENPCFVLPPDVCVEEAIYTAIVNLPPNVNGYDLVYQRCCRNPSIVNLINPEDAGVTFTTRIPSTNLIATNNSCPVFQNFPPVALCTGGSFIFDHGAIDPDGDDLVYEFCTPLHGATADDPAPTPEPPPYVNVTWAGGYSSNYPIDSNPAFNIDASTGALSGTPTQPGQYVIGICVKEYRNGFLINTVTRDFQFNVTICDPNIVAAIPEQSSLCDGLTVNFDNTSVNAQDFYWNFGDPSTEDDFSLDPSPSYTYADTGTFEVTLIANPSWTCADTAYQTFTAYPLVQPEIVGPEFECLNGQPQWTLWADGEYESQAEFTWSFPGASNQNASSQEFPNPLFFDTPGNYTVELMIQENTCDSTVSIEITVPPDPVAVIPAQDLFCNGLTFLFENNSLNSTSYEWSFGDPFSNDDESLDFEPEYTYSDTGSYVVNLTAYADNTCPNSTNADFTIHTLLDPFFLPAESQCFEGNSFNFTALGTDDSQAIYTWDFGEVANPSASGLTSPTGIHFIEPGSHLITLTISENGCEKTYEDEVEVVPNPDFNFYLGEQVGCQPYYSHFEDSSYSETPIFYTWDFGDGSTSTSASPNHLYQNAGLYDVTVTAYTLAGCAEEESFLFEDAVLVYPPPQAGIDVEPNVVDILQPDVFISDLSIGGTDCQYYMSDGGSMEDCEGWYSFTDGGTFEVYQIITDIQGCRDTAYATVIVNGHTLYIPNSFTPNGDGINDIFLPIALGVSTFRMEIYDRWGEIIFVSEDRKTPWVGDVHNGDHFAKDGVYIYYVVIEDQVGFPYEFTGHVTLFR
ncbi:MAG: gliding motility-associated-like protein [Litorivivens sp.]|jgi:gliding motility-associated-like protein